MDWNYIVKASENAEHFSFGCYASVFRLAKYPDVVFKQFFNDHSYIAYLDFLSTNNADSENYVKIYDYHFIHDDGDVIGYVAMESLQDLELYCTTDPYLYKIGNETIHIDFDSIGDQLSVWRTTPFKFNTDSNALRKFAFSCYFLKHWAIKNDYRSLCPDVHGRNIMVRNNDTLVLTDPYC